MSNYKNQILAFAVSLGILLFSGLAFLNFDTPFRDGALSAPNDPEVNELIAQARSLQRLGKWSEANEILATLANKGHPIAIYHLARAYKNGWGLSRDLSTARRWFTQAARYDFRYRGETAYEIGRLYQRSSGDDCDTIAVAWLQKALSWKFEKAHVQLATHFRYGLGVDQDTQSALHHYEQAAIAGYPSSTIKYAKWLLKGGAGIEAEPERARYWAKRAMVGLGTKASDGSGSAAKTLGRLYRDGVFVPTDLEEAERWFRRSSRLGDSGGMHELANLLLRMPQIEVRTKEALEWLEMAAELGHGGAVTSLGRLHLKKTFGLSEDGAVAWFEKGVSLRHPGSMEELARLLTEGRLIAQDQARALKLAQKGAKMGHEGSKTLLSELKSLADEKPSRVSKS